MARTLLYDLHTDPRQQCDIKHAAAEKRMIEHMVDLMRDCDTPAEQFQRLGLAD